ncbi:P74 [Phenacoccus solenopsis nudivirus]|nr:P74 [Phenacoccus solenopsis nudivirus]
MSTYTALDLENARKFSNYYNVRVRLLDAMHKKFPFLTSHLSYTIRDATSDDYYIPTSLKNNCKILEIKIPQKLCDKLSCNKYTQTGFCTPQTVTHYSYVGDNAYDVVCQPSCFRIGLEPTYGKDDTRNVDMPQLVYNKDKCLLIPDYVSNYLEKTYYRSDTKYENRVNDMPTGFSRVKSNLTFGSGFTYKNNATYCRYYDRTLNGDGDCSYTWWEKGLDALVGMNFINTIKSTVRKIDGRKVPFDLPEGLPELPPLDKRYTYDVWRYDIDEQFKVPPLMVFEDNDMHERIQLAKQNAKVRLANKLQPQRQRRNADLSDDDVDSGSSLEENETETNHLLAQLETLLGNLAEAFFTKEMLESLGINIAYNVLEAKLKKILTSTIQDLGKLLAKETALMLARAFPINVFRTSIMNVCRMTITRVVLRFATKTAIALLKLTALAVSVVGWIMIVGSLLDVLFSIWDPYGYNNLHPKEFPSDFMEAGERTLRSEFGTPDIEYTFEMLCNKLLTKEELLTISMSSILDNLIYLNALVVNSEGSLIEKGEPIYQEKANDAVEKTVVETTAKSYRFDSRKYREYNENFLKRVYANRVITYVVTAIATATVSLTLCGLNMVAFILLFFVVLLSAISRFWILSSLPLQIFDSLGEYGERIVNNVYDR